LREFSQLDTNNGCGATKEVFNNFRHKAPLLGLGRLPEDGREIQFSFCESFQSRIRDAAYACRVNLLDDSLFDQLLRHLITGVHVTEHFLQLIRREHLAENVEHLAGTLGVKVILNFCNALEELLKDSTLTRIGRYEIENEAVLLLAVSMNAAHALFQAHRIP